MTRTWSGFHPNIAARSTSSYWASRLSVCSRTWVIVDWRTYTHAWRFKCPGRTLENSLTAVLPLEHRLGD